jgi:hypothetical protein
MHPFQDYVHQRMTEHIRAWPSHIAHDICLMVCLIGFNEDDVRQGAAYLSCTTPAYWASQVPASSQKPEYDRWYYILMSPASILCLCKWSNYQYGGDDPGDVQGVALRDAYMASLDLTTTDEEMEERYTLSSKQWEAQQGRGTMTQEELSRLQEMEQRTSGLARAFIDVCADTVERLFTDGTITSVCGKPVPVVFQLQNDMGIEDYALERMREVNPPGLTDEYYHWKQGR